ncbi:hypothetical protein PYCC9005_002222 [Savitreella phatthalungensis]
MAMAAAQPTMRTATTQTVSPEDIALLQLSKKYGTSDAEALVRRLNDHPVLRTIRDEPIAMSAADCIQRLASLLGGDESRLDGVLLAKREERQRAIKADLADLDDYITSLFSSAAAALTEKETEKTELKEESDKIDDKPAVRAPVPSGTRTRSNTITTQASDDDARRPARGRKRSKSVAEQTPSPARRNAAATGSSDPAANKKLQASLVALLANIASHKCASIFAGPVSARDAPTYADLMKHPTDLKSIKARIKSGELSTIVRVHIELCRMFSNAVMFNPEDSEVTAMTREMHAHTEELVSLYREANESADDRAPKRRRKA